MEKTAVTLLSISLTDAAEEERLVAWWDEARALLTEKFRLMEGELLVFGRGRFQARLTFGLPGLWSTLIAKDRAWQALEERRPSGSYEREEARIFHTSGPVRDVTLAGLLQRLEERRAGRRDFVLVNALGAERFAEKHIPGSVNLPAPEVDEARAARVLGDKNREVIIYCGSYG